MRFHPTILFTFLALLATPLAAAGTAEAPEVTDPAGDAACFGPAGNEYADIVSAWISDESETTFNVNIALEKFTVDSLATATGYTVQFTHQGVQFGAVAAYIPAPMGPGWEYTNGYVDTTTGELGEFHDSRGSFTAGTPSILTIEFAKSLFPHGDMADNRLVNFVGGSADFKTWVPFFVADQEPTTDFVECDHVESSAVYEFQVGGHSQMDMSGSDNATMTPETPGGTTNASGTGSNVAPAATGGSSGGSGDDGKKVPAPGALLTVGAVIAVGIAMRRRS